METRLGLFHERMGCFLFKNPSIWGREAVLARITGFFSMLLLLLSHVSRVQLCVTP